MGAYSFVDHFNQLVQQGSLHAWIYLPAALVLGALHGLEPGHSKTMMAAFIIAIRGTVFQAILLGLCAALSHSVLIWILALLALHFGSQFNAGTAEPWFQLISALIIAGLALWMAWRTYRDVKAEADHHHHGHDHPHGDGHDPSHEHQHHEHGETSAEYQDAHELAHATEIKQKFAGGAVTNGQIVVFGLTGGLLPCPAAFTVVLVCLQLKKFALGIAMVLSFSIGLALTLVTVGALAALSLRHTERHFKGLGTLARKLPYISSVILFLMAIYIGFEGWTHLPR